MVCIYQVIIPSLSLTFGHVILLPSFKPFLEHFCAAYLIILRTNGISEDCIDVQSICVFGIDRYDNEAYSIQCLIRCFYRFY